MLKITCVKFLQASVYQKSLRSLDSWLSYSKSKRWTFLLGHRVASVAVVVRRSYCWWLSHSSKSDISVRRYRYLTSGLFIENPANKLRQQSRGLQQDSVPITIAIVQQEAQLSRRDCAMRRVSWNLANCHATVQYDKSWTNRSYEVGGLRWADV